MVKILAIKLLTHFDSLLKYNNILITKLNMIAF